jgi:hypothetical protein
VRLPGTGIYDTKVISRKRANRQRASRIAPSSDHRLDGPPPAGWFPDPHGGAFRRYWDGRAWTQATDEPAHANHTDFGSPTDDVSQTSSDVPDLDAPYGRYEPTGMPLSDKKATTAAKLQLFLGLLGAGRFYIGSFRIAFRQLGLGIVGFVLAQVTAHADTASGFAGMLLLGRIVWGVVDAVRMLRGVIPDGRGRKLR